MISELEIKSVPVIRDAFFMQLVDSCVIANPNLRKNLTARNAKIFTDWNKGF